MAMNAPIAHVLTENDTLRDLALNISLSEVGTIGLKLSGFTWDKGTVFLPSVSILLLTVGRKISSILNQNLSEQR